MRYVFLNRAVTPIDMPDPGARDSYFDGCTITGNFAHDLRNASVANCTITGDWSGAQIRYLTSFASDWRGCVLPPDVSSLNHDHVVGIIRRRATTLTGTRRTAALKVANYIAASYLNSWRDGTYRLVNEYGLTLAQVKAAFTTMFQGYPRLLARLTDVGTSKELLNITPPVTIPAANVIQVSDQSIDLLRDLRVVGEDRWAIERTLEVLGHLVHISTLHPYPIAMTKPAEQTRWDWWQFAGPRI